MLPVLFFAHLQLIGRFISSLCIDRVVVTVKKWVDSCALLIDDFGIICINLYFSRSKRSYLGRALFAENVSKRWLDWFGKVRESWSFRLLSFLILLCRIGRSLVSVPLLLLFYYDIISYLIALAEVNVSVKGQQVEVAANFLRFGISWILTVSCVVKRRTIITHSVEAQFFNRTWLLKYLVQLHLKHVNLVLSIILIDICKAVIIGTGILLRLVLRSCSLWRFGTFSLLVHRGFRLELSVVLWWWLSWLGVWLVLRSSIRHVRGKRLSLLG